MTPPAGAPDVTVVIPTYNSARFLAATLGSVFAQTLLPLEVIVADDASTDGTPELVEAIAATAPIPVRLVRAGRNSGGPAAPLNRGIAAARGGLIATLDHDDEMLPGKLARQSSCLDAEPGAGLCFARPLGGVAEDRQPNIADAARIVAALIGSISPGAATRIPSDKAYEALVRGQYTLTCSSFVFPREAWRRVGGFDEGMRIYCDCAFVQAIAARHDLVYVDDPLFRWTPHPDSLSRTRDLARYVDEYVCVLSRFAEGRLSAGARRERRAMIGEELLGAAYHLRNERDYANATRFYLGCFRRAGLVSAPLIGLSKLVAHRLLPGSIARRRRGLGPTLASRP